MSSYNTKSKRKLDYYDEVIQAVAAAKLAPPPVVKVTKKRNPKWDINNFIKKTTTRPAKNEVKPVLKGGSSVALRRSDREKDLHKKEQKQLNKMYNKISRGIERGMKMRRVPGKGRAVFATKAFRKGDFVVEYSGKLMKRKEGLKMEKKYAEDPSIGSYLLFFKRDSVQYCVDATKETGRLGRLISHSRKANLKMETGFIGIMDINVRLFVALMAARDIDIGEELTFDYGDTRREVVKRNPWLRT